MTPGESMHKAQKLEPELDPFEETFFSANFFFFNETPWIRQNQKKEESKFAGISVDIYLLI